MTSFKTQFINLYLNIDLDLGERKKVVDVNVASVCHCDYFFQDVPTLYLQSNYLTLLAFVVTFYCSITQTVSLFY